MKQVLDATRSAQVITFRAPETPAGFTSRDLLELHCWDKGGRRLEIDEYAECGEAGQFAMIYNGGEPWATWAISREDGLVLLWDCISLADIGRFATVREALARIPGAPVETRLPSAVRATAQVIRLCEVALRP